MTTQARNLPTDPYKIQNQPAWKRQFQIRDSRSRSKPTTSSLFQKNRGETWQRRKKTERVEARRRKTRTGETETTGAAAAVSFATKNLVFRCEPGDVDDSSIITSPTTDVAYLRISKVSIYVSSPQGLVRHHGLFDIDYHFKLIK